MLGDTIALSILLLILVEPHLLVDLPSFYLATALPWHGPFYPHWCWYTSLVRARPMKLFFHEQDYTCYPILVEIEGLEIKGSCSKLPYNRHIMYRG